jgi:non-ribosomal peptide synthetase component F
VPIVLNEELTAGLRELSYRQGTTLFMTLYAGFAMLLSRLSGQDSVVIGTPVANRQRVELEGLIGFFVNTLALHTRAHGQLSVRQLLEQVKELTLGAYTRQELPFEHVVEAVQPKRNLSYSPLFQAFFVFQNAPDSGVDLSGVTVSAPQTSAAAADTAQFDLSLSLTKVGNRILGILNYASDLFDGETVEGWAQSLHFVLRQMVRDSEQRIEDLELPSGAKRRCGRPGAEPMGLVDEISRATVSLGNGATGSWARNDGSSADQVSRPDQMLR